MSSADRRKHRRVALRVPATLYVHGEQAELPGHIQDFSESGASFTSPYPVDVNAVIYIGFSVGTHADRPRCEATGRIIRVLPFGAIVGAGIEFQFADENFIAYLRQLADCREAERMDLLGQIRDLELHLATPSSG